MFFVLHPALAGDHSRLFQIAMQPTLCSSFKIFSQTKHTKPLLLFFICKSPSFGHVARLFARSQSISRNPINLDTANPYPSSPKSPTPNTLSTEIGHNDHSIRCAIAREQLHPLLTVKTRAAECPQNPSKLASELTT